LPIATRRDAVFRRLLALADVLAATGGVAVISSVNGRIATVGLATVPLIVILAKVAGRYDADEILLRKSTIDEAPRLVALAAAYAIAWSLVTVVAGLHTTTREMLALWGSTSVLLFVGRWCARALGQRAAPAERVLVVGGSAARSELAPA
jgi:hypothetical protein